MKRNKIKARVKKNKYMKLSRTICFMLPTVFIIALGIMVVRSGLSYEEMIIRNPILTVGFIVSILNLLIGYLLNKIIKESYSESNKIIMCISAIALFITFNYPASILLLVEVFNIHRHEKSTSFISWRILKKKELYKICGLATFCLTCISMSYWFMNSFS